MRLSTENRRQTLSAAPIRASGVKRAWVIGPAAFPVSPGWA